MTVHDRLTRAKKFLAIAESKDAKSQAFKLAAKEVAEYRAETGATYTDIALALGREKAGGTWVRTLVKWHEDGYPTPTPWAIPSENDRVRLAHGKRALREATPAQLQKMVDGLPAERRSALVSGVIGDLPQEQVERVVAELPKQQRQALGAAAGQPYLAARQEYDEQEGRLTERERRERDEAVNRATQQTRELSGGFAALGIAGHLNQATEELNELAADASVTKKQLREIEQAHDRFVTALDFVRDLAGVKRED